jgi:protein transport protein SEC13
MASAPLTQDTGHADTVHDVQLDYYGRKLATASSDRTIRVFDVTGDQLAPLTTLQGHEGPVWQVSWSHPKFGNLLASCSFDNRVIIWKEQQDGSWLQVSHVLQQISRFCL